MEIKINVSFTENNKKEIKQLLDSGMTIEEVVNQMRFMDIDIIG